MNTAFPGMGLSNVSALAFVAGVSVFSLVADAMFAETIPGPSMQTHAITEAITKAPFLCAIVVVVWLFLKAQRSMAEDFNRITDRSNALIDKVAERSEVAQKESVAALQENTKAIVRFENTLDDKNKMMMKVLDQIKTIQKHE